MARFDIRPPGIHPHNLPEHVRNMPRNELRVWLRDTRRESLVEFSKNLAKSEELRNTGMIIVADGTGYGVEGHAQRYVYGVVVDIMPEMKTRLHAMLPEGWMMREINRYPRSRPSAPSP